MAQLTRRQPESCSTTTKETCSYPSCACGNDPTKNRANCGSTTCSCSSCGCKPGECKC
ncbi:uncharacterized protein ARMOST_09629 [Armillaria ostoyae]|uniref:Metallothionein n=1 Tax=Armillaria ostoyae TaxID=47428 RepID=A0A284RC06_ARMOS|nr:uncharacterized protein ARMOST_09629 [Armillaria ostoyae]